MLLTSVNARCCYFGIIRLLLSVELHLTFWLNHMFGLWQEPQKGTSHTSGEWQCVQAEPVQTGLEIPPHHPPTCVCSQTLFYTLYLLTILRAAQIIKETHLKSDPVLFMGLETDPTHCINKTWIRETDIKVLEKKAFLKKPLHEDMNSAMITLYILKRLYREIDLKVAFTFKRLLFSTWHHFLKTVLMNNAQAACALNGCLLIFKGADWEES